MSKDNDMGIRGEALPIDLLAAVKLAVASQDMASKDRAFDLIAWIVELHEPSERPKSVDLFIEAIKETKRAPADKKAPSFVQPSGIGTTFQNPIKRPENIC